MSIRNLVSTLALAACTLAPITSHAASIFGHGAASGASVTNPALKSKMIKFTLSNKTSAPMNLLINEQPVTLAANSQMPIKAAEGSDIFAEDHTTVKVHVTGDLSGNTVSFR